MAAIPTAVWAEQPATTSAGAVAEPALLQADGALRHLFSVSFTADRAVLETITGLVTQRVARTASGGEIEVAFPDGVPYPQGAGTVTVLQTADPDRGLIFDFLARPSGIPERPGWVLVTSHRDAGRPARYLLVWRDQVTGEYMVTLFDAALPEAPQPVIARSRAAILGIARSPSILAANYYLTVWTMPEAEGDPGSEGQVTAESYTWRPEGF